MITLAAEKRDPKAASLSALRTKGLIPAVVYGAHHESMSIAVDAKAFAKVLREAGEATESTIVSLSGVGAALPTLIHEIAFDPIKGFPLHVDFYAVTKGEKVEVAIPLSFVGESAAVEAGANLVKVMHEIEVEADPMNLPTAIDVNLSALAAEGDQIHAKDLALPKGVTLVGDPEEVIALAQAVVEEKEEAPAADLSAIEVEKKGKEEAAAGAEAEAK
ncbi:MAG TPA: 50S ribosomal protein L25 [Chloroflexota bacterium]